MNKSSNDILKIYSTTVIQVNDENYFVKAFIEIFVDSKLWAIIDDKQYSIFETFKCA